HIPSPHSSLDSTLSHTLSSNSALSHASAPISPLLQHSNFTTNREPNTLLNQFKNVINDKNIEELAFLIGYFRISGFIHLHNLLKDKYDKFKSIRILVGLNVDREIYELEQNNLDIKYEQERFIECFIKAQRKFINKEKTYDVEIDNSIEFLLYALKEKKLQIKMIRDKNVHAKFYLFYSNPQHNHTNPNQKRYEGSLIVGSSNLSQNGLEKNYEVNLLSKGSDDITFALSEFNHLWQNAIPIDYTHVEKAKEDTYLAILPLRDLYYKLLLSHFGDSKEDDSIPHLFKDFTPYPYQVHAVTEGITKLKKYNGFFLSDVVGLGKTLIASVIAKKCQKEGFITGKILIIAKPALTTSWKEHFDRIEIHNYETYTPDSLHKIEPHEKAKIELIIIDESHNFRGSSSNRYENLKSICETPYQHNGIKKKKKCILISATPQNNVPSDLANQCYLFLPKHNSGIEGCNDLQDFFSKQQKIYKEAIEESKDKSQQIQKNAQEKLELNAKNMRDKLLTHIMIRRTRADIAKLYKEDMQKQGLSFPKIEVPKDLTYNLDDISHNLASESIALLDGEATSMGSFKYVRYLIFPNLTQEGQAHFIQEYGEKAKGGKNENEWHTDTAKRLSTLIQIILFKRFESSIAALKATLNNQIQSHQALIQMLQRSKVLIPTAQGDREKLYEAIQDEDDEALQTFLEDREDKYISLSPKHFQKDYLKKLEEDKATLERLLAKWEEIEIDPKLEELKKFLREKLANKEQKIVIFSEAKTSVEHLEKHLKDFTPLCIHAANRDNNQEALRANFDANYPKEHQSNDHQLVITTDTLSEGVNLHRANIIINYDAPYNATILMQRIGRIKRIGTSAKSIHIYNFKPHDISDKITNINAITRSKLRSFHSTLGEDAAIYDDDEKTQSWEIFSKVKENLDELSPETPFINDLKALSEHERARIKALPNKCRSIIETSQVQSPISYAYIAYKKAKQSFYSPYVIAPIPANERNLLQKDEREARECDFFTLANFLRKELENKPLNGTKLNSWLGLHYSDVQKALECFKESQKPHSSLKKTSNLKHAEINAIAKIRHLEGLDPAITKRVIDAIKNGERQNLAKEINKRNGSDLRAYLESLNLHTLEENSQKEHKSKKPQIELSITAIPTKGNR
ncbi:helicase-related protein, partial [Helicobacter marmotae]|uniref:helicase-related protein n=1 Tax=Helicobacter marmotae TaxID=152490 RepID=UPI000CF19F8D